MEGTPLLEQNKVHTWRRINVPAVISAACIALAVLVVYSAVQGDHEPVIADLSESPAVAYVPALGQQRLQYIYVPEQALQQHEKKASRFTTPEDPLFMPQPLLPSFVVAQGNILAGAGNNTTADGGLPPWHVRSCAISSLVVQAKGVLMQWDKCGYLFQGQPKFENPAKPIAPSAEGTVGVISAPADDTECTPSKMNTPKCRKEFTRTIARNDHDTLYKCMLSIRGLSQTCDTYSACGPTPSLNSAIKSFGTQSVCNAPDGGYYKEPEVERMCGVCEMFHAVAGAAVTPHYRDTVGEDESGGGGCFAHGSAVEVQNVGSKDIKDVKVGDMVRVSGQDYRRAYFVHDHESPADTLKIRVGQNEVEMTPSHFLPIYTAECGEKFCDLAKLVPASTVKNGDFLYTENGVEMVKSISSSRSLVRYLLVEGGNVLVNGVLASVHSTAAGELETLPFRFLDTVFPGILQTPAVKHALHAALESPVLRLFELMIARMPALPLNFTPRLLVSSSSSK